LKLNCVIVDDEPLARKLIADYVQKVPALHLVDSCADPLTAMEVLRNHKVDLLFLDIQMPELTGIQFMKIIRKKCKVILTTAYAQYALEGYEHDVVDYLLKPVTLDRFIIAVQKAKDRIGVAVPLQTENPETPVARRPDHVFIKTEYRIQRVDLADISYIEALRDYVALHIGAEKILTLESMRHMEEILPEDHFIRIHKSYIVNRNKIDYLERSRVVIGKEHLPIGDTYKEKVRVKLGIV